MRLPATLALPLLLLTGGAGCGSAGDSPPAAAAPPAAASTAPAPPSSPPTGVAPAPPDDAAGLPDLSADLEVDACADGPGNEGADSHFIGEFQIQGSTVTGTERWLLHANPKLLASKHWDAGPDCEVRWLMTGVTTAPRHCGTCDLGLDLTASADLTGSTCPEDLVKRESSFKVSYDVQRGSDGVAYVYFAGSGKLLGQGYHQTDGQTSRFNYVTRHQCKWF
ncbi:MAG: hypothetical protein D6798_00035 [Deltaproteobacteria bacterium]|nr:MAG: hypothetical protein D6798_00035 [Deltaproteobacteria bacterium]